MLSLAVTKKKSHFEKFQGNPSKESVETFLRRLNYCIFSPPDSIEERRLPNTVDIIDGGPEGGAELDNVQDCLVTMGAVGTGLVQHRDVGVGQLATKVEPGVRDWGQQVLIKKQ